MLSDMLIHLFDYTANFITDKKAEQARSKNEKGKWKQAMGYTFVCKTTLSKI